MDLSIIKQALGYHFDGLFPSVVFALIEILSSVMACSFFTILLYLIPELNFKSNRKILLKITSGFLISILVFISIGRLNNVYERKQEESFKRNVLYIYEEIFVPFDINSVTIEDYTKELLIDKTIYNIKAYDEIEVKKVSNDIQGLVLYKLNITSNTSKKDINERIDKFNKNPIYVLKEIRY